MALVFIYPLSLVSPFPLSFRNKKNRKKELWRRVRKRAEEIGREEGYDEVRQRSTHKESPSAYPSTALVYKLLSCVLPVKVKRKQKERREREVRDERQRGGHLNFLEKKRRDKKQGDVGTQQGAKKMELFFIYHLSLRCLPFPS